MIKRVLLPVSRDASRVLAERDAMADQTYRHAFESKKVDDTVVSAAQSAMDATDYAIAHGLASPIGAKPQPALPVGFDLGTVDTRPLAWLSAVEHTADTLAAERMRHETYKAYAKADRERRRAIRASGKTVVTIRDGGRSVQVQSLASRQALRPSMPSRAIAQSMPDPDLAVPVRVNYKRMGIGMPSVTWHDKVMLSHRTASGKTEVETVYVERIEPIDYSAHATGKMNTRKGLTPQGKTSSREPKQDGAALAAKLGF
jgi:hypothetical protein